MRAEILEYCRQMGEMLKIIRGQLVKPYFLNSLVGVREYAFLKRIYCIICGDECKRASEGISEIQLRLLYIQAIESC